MKAGVFGLGAITVDFVGIVEQWPEKGSKTRLQDIVITGGGLVGNAMVTVARLGGKAFIAGRLGDSLMAEYAIESLRREKVNTRNIIRLAESEPVRSFILSEKTGGERSIFFSRKQVSYPLPEEFPDQDWYKKVNVLLTDHGTGEAGYRTAVLARKKGVQVIIDAERNEPGLEKLLKVTDHIIVGKRFAIEYTGERKMEAALKKLKTGARQIVIITRGDKGLIGMDADGIFRQPAFAVRVTDTTGCGDVFHGAYALAISRGLTVRDSCLIAGAAAALSATRTGGRLGIPTWKELRIFMEANDVTSAGKLK